VTRVNNTWFLMIPIFLGTAFQAYVFGLDLVNPLNISWLFKEDSLQAYLGWDFYRHSPWSFPVIGMSPMYGLDVSSSVVYTDSNPLMAIIFKILSPILPEKFQYFGIWILACCILSSLALWKIFSLYTDNIYIKIASTALVLFMPSWIFRIGHLNLMSHFLILFAIYLCICKQTKYHGVKWAMLISLACLIHFYIAMMVMIFWGFSVVARFIYIKDKRKSLCFECIDIAILVAALLFMSGYFTVSSVSPGGYGSFNNNLLSPLMPAGWSHFFNIPGIGSTGFEGFNYWGVGYLLVILASLPWTIRLLPKFLSGQKRLAIGLSILTFILISTTNHISVGMAEFNIHLPEKMVEKLSIFRASSRFFWPVTYCAIIFSIIALIKNVRPSLSAAIIAIAAVIQITDTTDGYAKDRFYFFTQPKFVSPLNSGLWSDIIVSHPSIRYVPFMNQGENWKTLALLAHDFGVPTDAVYMARVDEKKAGKMNSLILRSLSNGSYDRKTTYVISDDYVDKIRLKDGDRIIKIDGFNVLASGYQGCPSCHVVKDDSQNNPSYSLLEGWYDYDGGGAWSKGGRSSLVVTRSKGDNAVVLYYNAYVTPNHPAQRVKAMINGIKVLDKEVRSSALVRDEVPIPAIVDGESMNIDFEFQDAISPHDLGISEDKRSFAIHLNRVETN